MHTQSFSFPKFALTAVSFGALGFLSACGGGGGGGATSASSLSTTPVALTAANYQTAASEVVSSSGYLANSASLATGVETTSGNVQTLVQFAQSRLKALPAVSGGNLPSGAVASQSIPCTTGSMFVTVSVAGSTLAAGDSATFSASNCYDAPTGTTFNGSFSLNVTNATGDFLNSSTYNIGLNMTFNNFVAVTGSSQISGNGSISVSENSTSLYSTDAVMSASSFSSTAQYATTSYQRQLTNFIINQTVRPNTPTSTYKITSSMSGTVSSSGLGGNAVTVSTITPFVQLSSDLYPYTGQAIATGSNSSKVRLTAQNATSVLIELDATGDATYEASVVKTWASL